MERLCVFSEKAFSGSDMPCIDQLALNEKEFRLKEPDYRYLQTHKKKTDAAFQWEQKEFTRLSRLNFLNDMLARNTDNPELTLYLKTRIDHLQHQMDNETNELINENGTLRIFEIKF